MTVGGKMRTVGEVDLDLVGALDDVVVGHHQSRPRW